MSACTALKKMQGLLFVSSTAASVLARRVFSAALIPAARSFRGTPVWSSAAAATRVPSSRRCRPAHTMAPPPAAAAAVPSMAAEGKSGTVADAPAAAPAPSVTKRGDYTPPAYLVETVDLRFDLDDTGVATRVSSRLVMNRNEKAPGGTVPLVLNGDKEMSLVAGSLKLDGVALPADAYTVDSSGLTVASVPTGKDFVIESTVEIAPSSNKALEGLYMSGGNYCTQCEAEGFRRITFYPDRPDVMAVYTTTITADKELFPVLLSNGNCVQNGDLDGGRHYVKYEDPFKKSSYLFAVVAGRLVSLDDEFVTCSGKKVTLRVWVRDGDVPKCTHAMAALKSAMKWDEDQYGREYDLDIYQILVVDDFNMGAMENRSLNVFNSKYVLASPETATDSDYNGISGVIAHEYFHNYSGNRVTCRSWFELTLKEGLTVFRDQCAAAEGPGAWTPPVVKRISDVTRLRSSQFPQDAGPMAHPIRPESYVEINNFYTATVYEKGAAVVRMSRTLLGKEGFRRGAELYFERHDGQAVTCDDWMKALVDANPDGPDMTQFMLWYSQAGTPVLTIGTAYDAAARTLTLNVEQTVPATPGQPTKEPMHIPLATGLVGPDGAPVPVDVEGTPAAYTVVLSVRKAKESFVLRGVPEGTVPSLLRDFSAPVKLVREGGVDRQEVAFLMANDTDDFNRWEAAQTLGMDVILEYVNTRESDSSASFEPLSDAVIEAFRKTLRDEKTDPSLRARVMVLPDEGYVAEQVSVADPLLIHEARDSVKKQLATALRADLEAVAAANAAATAGEYKIDPASQGARALKNVCLQYLAALGETATLDACLETVRTGSNMTDVLAALGVLSNSPDCPQREAALSEFYAKWKNDYLVMVSWLRIQAMASRPDALTAVKALMKHEAFDITNPNNVYSVVGGYAMANPVGFHSPPSGEGYIWLADVVLQLDKNNPQVAARMVSAFTRWRKYNSSRQETMKAQLERIRGTKGLSNDVFEICDKSLAA